MGRGLPKPLPPHAATSSSKPRDSKLRRATSPRPASRSRSEVIPGDAAGSRVSRAARGDSAARMAGWWAALAGLPGFDPARAMEPGAEGRWTAPGCAMSRSADTAYRGRGLRLTWSSFRAGAVGLAGLCRPTSCGRPAGGGGGPVLSGCRWAGSCAVCTPSGALGSDRPGRGAARPPAARWPPARSPETAEVSEAGGARRAAARTRSASSLAACAARHDSAWAAALSRQGCEPLHRTCGPAAASGFVPAPAASCPFATAATAPAAFAAAVFAAAVLPARLPWGETGPFPCCASSAISSAHRRTAPCSRLSEPTPATRAALSCESSWRHKGWRRGVAGWRHGVAGCVAAGVPPAAPRAAPTPPACAARVGAAWRRRPRPRSPRRPSPRAAAAAAARRPRSARAAPGSLACRRAARRGRAPPSLCCRRRRPPARRASPLASPPRRGAAVRASA
eukprot:scaffold7769_cov68-Phaeocystis_antarctica.AAC.5